MQSEIHYKLEVTRLFFTIINATITGTQPLGSIKEQDKQAKNLSGYQT